MVNFYQFTHFKAYTSLHHAITTKSKIYPYSFSLALHTGERDKDIIQNRKILSKSLDSKNNLHYIVANQTHSNHIKIITQEKTKGWNSLEDAIVDCDALITDIPNIVLCILTADCVPILLYDKVKNIIAAVHAGWKGTQGRIVYKTIQKMQSDFGSNPTDILVGIAPSIQKCCYEVDENVAQHFFNTPQGFSKKGDKYMLDLPYINKEQLLSAGVQEEHIEMSNICTACHVEDFFSYRKENGCSGRFMSLIYLT